MTVDSVGIIPEVDRRASLPAENGSTYNFIHHKRLVSVFSSDNSDQDSMREYSLKFTNGMVL